VPVFKFSLGVMSGGYIQGLAGRYFMGPAYTPWSVADIKLAVDS